MKKLFNGLTINGLVPNHAQMDPQNSIFWMALLRVPVFYDIRRYLTDNYFDSTFLEVP